MTRIARRARPFRIVRPSAALKQLLVGSCVLLAACQIGEKKVEGGVNDPGPESPRIVNIINFVRLCEPRIKEYTEEVLYQTVVEQVKAMREQRLRGTFLLQYDALMDPRYQELMKSLPPDSFEVGAWWEIPQPLVEQAGMQWRGRFPWDWHANVGFSTGYTPKEREKLVDVYMEAFRKIFGRTPASVGSWFIDAHTMNYLFDKYKITASCNCKDQYGTDGYTLWGGYWSQAYYPSRLNSYMPAQTEERQLPVPVFRMLGSDPVRQYDLGLPSNGQGVITLEPVYPFGGGDSTWVHWYFEQFLESTSLGFSYVQTGQENSFTWGPMAKGFSIQLPLIAKLRDEGKVRVETLEESGRWFRERYRTTPATSVTVSRDLPGSDRKTAWFNSRFYRVNLLWEEGRLRIRDIHLFDEDFPSFYTEGVATSNACEFFTLPFMDGYLWSSKDTVAGIQLVAVVGGKEILLEGGDPAFSEPKSGLLHVAWPLTNIPGTLQMDMDETHLRMHLESEKVASWHLDVIASGTGSLPFTAIGEKRVDCRFQERNYAVEAEHGRFVRPPGRTTFKVEAEGDRVALNLGRRE